MPEEARIREDSRRVESSAPRRYVNPIPEEGDNGVYTQSWFVICMSHELRPGELMSREFLSGRVVAYRDDDGDAHVVSAYCPHLGADLACGKVVGNHLRCAFHGWEYGSDGRCKKTAIGERAPPHARLFTFPVKEKYGMVWAFNGEEPLWDLPSFNPPYDRDDSLAWAVERRDPQYLCSPWVFCCNTLDIQHIITVHGFTFPEGSLGSIHDRVRWQQFGFDYDISAHHQGGVSLDWQIGIRGTSLFWQQGMYDDFWFGFVQGFSLPRPGIHDGYLAIAVAKGDGSPRGNALVQKRLKTAMDLEIRTIEEDRHILDRIHCAPGHLIGVDRSLARFFDYLRNYPRAHPSRDFIR